MIKTLTLVFFLCFSFYAFSSPNMELINGDWDCSERIEEDGYISDIKVTDSYNVANYTFTSDGTVELKYKSTLVVKFKVISQGTFTVEKDMIAPVFTSVDVEVISGYMSVEDLNQLKQGMLNDKGSYKTIKVDNKTWVAVDLTDNKENVCNKI